MEVATSFLRQPVRDAAWVGRPGKRATGASEGLSNARNRSVDRGGVRMRHRNLVTRGGSDRGAWADTRTLHPRRGFPWRLGKHGVRRHVRRRRALGRPLRPPAPGGRRRRPSPGGRRRRKPLCGGRLLRRRWNRSKKHRAVEPRSLVGAGLGGGPAGQRPGRGRRREPLRRRPLQHGGRRGREARC